MTWNFKVCLLTSQRSVQNLAGTSSITDRQNLVYADPSLEKTHLDLFKDPISRGCDLGCHFIRIINRAIDKKL
jgi:hypothetical protein